MAELHRIELSCKHQNLILDPDQQGFVDLGNLEHPLFESAGIRIHREDWDQIKRAIDFVFEYQP